MNRTGGRAAGWASHRIAYRSIVYSVDHVCGAALGISGSLAPGCKTKSNPAAGSRNRQTNDRAPTGRRRVEDRRPAYGRPIGPGKGAPRGHRGPRHERLRHVCMCAAAAGSRS